MNQILKQNDLNCEHIAKIIVELAPKYKYTYAQLYYFIFERFRKGIKLQDITKDMIETSIEENRKLYNGGVQGTRPSFVIYDDIEKG
jgi:hypothetical protein